MDKSLLKVRKRLKEDYGYYAANALKIRTKNGEIAPLELNEAQGILDEVVQRQRRETGRVRVVILKGRQQGLSTYVGGYLYFDTSQRRGAKSMVVAHKSESTETLFDMTKRYHEYVPDILRPNTKYSSKRELSFDKLDSSYVVATAGGSGPGRGETLQNVHASEIAFWTPSTARDNWNGLKKAVPNAPGTSIFIESTANGVGNLFHELWQGAVNGTNEYEAVFIPWFLQKEYRKTPPPNFERTHEEKELAERFPLDDAQLYWRRLEIGENGLELFQQEYPCTAEEAFLTSGRPVFHPQKVQALLEKAEAPEDLMALEGDKFESHPRGELRVFRKPEADEHYFIGGDVGSGIKGRRLPNGEYEKDPSVLCVLDSQKRQCAVWRGYVEPDLLGHVTAALGEWYNWAFVAVESNNHGILPLHILSKELFYPHLYQVTSVDKVNNKETVRLGFDTNVKTRPLIIDELRQELRNETIQISDAITLREMKTFVVTESGKMEAEEGCHDDTVIALAIANHVHDGDAQFVDNEDDFYQEAL